VSVRERVEAHIRAHDLVDDRRDESNCAFVRLGDDLCEVDRVPRRRIRNR